MRRVLSAAILLAFVAATSGCGGDATINGNGTGNGTGTTTYSNTNPASTGGSAAPPTGAANNATGNKGSGPGIKPPTEK